LTTITTPLVGLRLTLKGFSPNARIGWHEHQAGAICVLLRGDMREDMGDGEGYHGPGDVVFKPANVRHRNAFGPSGTSILTVALADRLIEQLTASDFSLAKPFVTRATEISIATRRLAVAMRNEASLRCEALALQLLAAVREAQATARSSRSPAVTVLRNTVLRRTSAPLQLSRLARAAGVTTAQLARAVRRDFGVSVRTYVQQIRVEQAAMLLDEGLPIATVALELGYYDQSHFTRTFKRVTGLTPGVYQRTHPDQCSSLSLGGAD
jgi:AraC family transcriptional regulator